MDKEQKKALVEAWQLHSKIIREIRDLALMNEALAYGCVRTAETIIDMLMVDKLRETQKESLEEVNG